MSDLDDLIARLDPAMVVITTTAEGERAGCLVGFHSQCSIEPLRYVVWLSKANHTYRVASRATHLAVHFLAANQHDLAELFGGTSSDDHDKFEACAWTAGPHGVPLLDDVANRFVGERVALLDEGSDHVCVVLQPASTDVAADGFEPLRLAAATDIEPGHDAEERPHPPTERAV